MATLTYSEGCCCLFRILCSIICPHKLSIQPMTYSLAPKRLLNVSYKSQKRAAKYSLLLHCQKEAIRELQPLAQYCAHAHSVPRVCENPISSFVRSTSILIILVATCNAYHIHNSFLWNN